MTGSGTHAVLKPDVEVQLPCKLRKGGALIYLDLKYPKLCLSPLLSLIEMFS